MKTDIDHDLLHGQFILCPDDSGLPENWITETCSGFHLARHPSTPLQRIQDWHGQQMGWCVGFRTDPEKGEIDEGPIRIDTRRGQPDEQEIERTLYRFGGRFVCILLTDAWKRIYLDPLGSLPVVFNKTRGRAASSLTLLGASLPSAEAFPLSRAGRGGFFPCGLTGHVQIKKILPDFYLDLKTGRVGRHWPGDDFAVMDESRVPEALDRLRRTLEGQLKAVAGKPGLHLGLTGGRNTRMLLACCRDVIEQTRWITVDGSSGPARRDRAAAEQLAAAFGLDHTVLPPVRLTPAQRRNYILRTGGLRNTAGAVRDGATLTKHLDLASAWAWGGGGEIGRAHLWRALKTPERTRTAREMLAMLRIPEREGFIHFVELWRDGLCGFPQPLQLDLWYLEQVLGCSVAPHLLGVAPFERSFIPWNHRTIVEQLLTLPRFYRRRRKVVEDLIQSAWPELLELPFDDP
ncbi:MAG: hypothetical protein AAF492_06795 [Verrucomicrobiota bacterium]